MTFTSLRLLLWQGGTDCSRTDIAHRRSGSRSHRRGGQHHHEPEAASVVVSLSPFFASSFSSLSPLFALVPLAFFLHPRSSLVSLSSSTATLVCSAWQKRVQESGREENPLVPLPLSVVTSSSSFLLGLCAVSAFCCSSREDRRARCDCFPSRTFLHSGISRLPAAFPLLPLTLLLPAVCTYTRRNVSRRSGECPSRFYSSRRLLPPRSTRLSRLPSTSHCLWRRTRRMRTATTRTLTRCFTAHRRVSLLSDRSPARPEALQPRGGSPRLPFARTDLSLRTDAADREAVRPGVAAVPPSGREGVVARLLNRRQVRPFLPSLVSLRHCYTHSKPHTSLLTRRPTSPSLHPMPSSSTSPRPASSSSSSFRPTLTRQASNAYAHASTSYQQSDASLQATQLWIQGLEIETRKPALAQGQAGKDAKEGEGSDTEDEGSAEGAHFDPSRALDLVVGVRCSAISNTRFDQTV